MIAHAFPSAEFPGPVPVRLSVPDGWQPNPAPGSAMSFVDSMGPDGVRASLIVVVQRVGGDPTLDEVAAKLRSQTGAIAAGSATLTSDVRTVAGQTAIRTVLRVPVPRRSVILVQAQAVLALDTDARGQRAVVQLHFTCAADQWSRWEPVFDEVLRTVEVGAGGT